MLQFTLSCNLDDVPADADRDSDAWVIWHFIVAITTANQVAAAEKLQLT